MDTAGNLGFEEKTRAEVIQNRSEFVGFMRFAEDLAMRRSAKIGV